MKEFLKNFSSHLLFYNVFDNFSTFNSFSSQWFIFLVILESHAKISVLVIIFHPDMDFLMPKALTPTTRIAKARALIQTARELPIPESAGWEYFSYVAQVKDKLRQAFELVKLIPKSPNTPNEVKAEAQAVMAEITQAEAEILKPSHSNS